MTPSLSVATGGKRRLGRGYEQCRRSARLRSPLPAADKGRERKESGVCLRGHRGEPGTRGRDSGRARTHGGGPTTQKARNP